MESSLSSVLIILMLSFNSVHCSNISTNSSSHLQILAVISGQDSEDGILQPSWYQSEHIVTGAQAAARHINKNPAILQQFHLQIVPIFVPFCDPTRGIDSLVKNLTSSDTTIIGTVGLFCDKVAEVYSPVIGHRRTERIQIAGTSLMDSNKRGMPFLPHLFSMLPSSRSLVQALLAVLRGFSWRRLGVVRVGGNSFITSNYAKVAELLQNAVSNDNESVVEVFFHYEIIYKDALSISLFLRALKNSPVNIIIAFVPPETATSIICSAHSKGFVWPEYVWIFVGLDPKDEIPFSSSLICGNQSIGSVLFLVHELNSDDDCSSFSVLGDTKMNSSDEVNSYANVLYDSVWALSLAVNASISELVHRGLLFNNYKFGNSEATHMIESKLEKLEFQGRTGCVEFRGRVRDRLRLKVFHMNNSRPMIVGWYEFRNGSLDLNLTSLLPLPLDTLRTVNQTLPLPYTVLLLLWIGFLFLLNSVSLVFFLIYRNKPAIKASSFPLSICISTGCFIILITPTHSIITYGLLSNFSHLTLTYCNIEVMSSVIGIDLVLAPLLLHLLRVYYIFHHFGKVGKRWADSRLMVWVLLIMLIKISIFILWLSLDINHLVPTKTIVRKSGHPPYYLMSWMCHSNYMTMWIAIIYGLSSAFSIPLLILAFLTRKIKRSNFKDTKKINFLAISLIVLLISCATLWGALRQVGEFLASNFFFNFGHSMVIFLTQIVLFLPKVIPPFYHQLLNIAAAYHAQTVCRH